jgi:hypothetical protein
MASEGNSKLFHKLVNRQCKAGSSDGTGELHVGNCVLKTDDSIRAGWGEYFHNVSSPNDDPGFDTAYQDHIAADVALFNLKFISLTWIPQNTKSF